MIIMSGTVLLYRFFYVAGELPAVDVLVSPLCCCAETHCNNAYHPAAHTA